MSFAADNEDEDQSQSQVDQNQQGGTGLGQTDQQATPGSQTDVSLGGGGTGVATAGAPGSPSMGSSTSKPSSSGSWTNLQSYLDANKDQSDQLGQQVTGAVSQQANQAQSDLANANNDFQSQVDSNTVKENDQSVNQAITDAQNAKAGSTYDPNELAGFQSQYNAAYNGPTDFTQDQYYGQTQNDINQAQQALEATQSEAGRDTLLQSQFGKTGQYNQGENALDQLLLEGNPNNQQAFSNLNDQYTGIGNALTGATATNNQYAQTGAQTSAATAAAAQAALGTANTNFQSGLNSQLTAAQKAYQDSNSSIQAALSTPNLKLNGDQIISLGLNPYESTYGLNLGTYLTPGTAPTLANSASADQYAQSAALAALAGTNSAPYLDPASASMAGSAGSPYSFNTQQFNTDAGAAHAGLTQSELNLIQQHPELGAGGPLNAMLQPVGTAPQRDMNSLTQQMLAGDPAALARWNQIYSALTQTTSGFSDNNASTPFQVGQVGVPGNPGRQT